MNVERERVADGACFRWVFGRCDDPYCRVKIHAWGMLDVGGRDRWFLAAVLERDELEEAHMVEDVLLEDPDLLGRATTLAVLWGCRWEGVTPQQIAVQSMAFPSLGPHGRAYLEGLRAEEGERLRKLCKGGVYPALLDMMGAYVADVGGETRRPIGGSDEGEDGDA